MKKTTMTFCRHITHIRTMKTQHIPIQAVRKAMEIAQVYHHHHRVIRVIALWDVLFRWESLKLQALFSLDILWKWEKNFPFSFIPKKLAGGKKSPWFLDSWNSKDTKNDSSLDYEDAKDLPIELRRLEDFDDIPEPLSSSAGLKSRSLGSILNPPPKQIVRSRSSVPSLGAEIKQSQIIEPLNNHTPVTSSVLSTSAQPTPRRPKLIKQKQSISDDPEFPFDENSPYKNITHNDMRAQLLRKQSSLNEELMAESRIREKERIRKRIQKQMSLNETFLCRSLFTKRLQVIREGFTTKLKTSTGSLERVTKSGIVKIMQNIKSASNTGQCNQSTAENATNRTSENKATKNGPLSRKLSSGNSYERSSSVCSSVNNGDESEKIRRHSRESGSGNWKCSWIMGKVSEKGF